MFLLSIIGFLLILVVIISLHEYGHYKLAKKSGAHVYEFSVGMGPLLYTKKKNGTYYSVRAIPVGGYVAIAEERQEKYWFPVGKDIYIQRGDNGKIKYFTNKERENFEKIKVTGFKREGDLIKLNDEYLDDQAYRLDGVLYKKVPKENELFEYKTKKQRFATLFAGPAVNIVLGLFLFSIVSVIQGFPVEEATDDGHILIGEVSQNSPAEGTFYLGDKVYSINGRSLSEFSYIGDILNEDYERQNFVADIERDGERKEIEFNSVFDVRVLGVILRQTDEGVLVQGYYSGSGASGAGVDIGDYLVSLDGKTINGVNDVAEFFEENDEGGDVLLGFERDGEVIEEYASTWSKRFLEGQDSDAYRAFLGVSPPSERNVGKSLFVGGVQETANAGRQILYTLGALFSGEVGLSDLSGPVGIYYITSNALQQGAVQTLTWMGLLSINVAILNLLPLPALDGGRITSIGYELVFGKEPNESIETKLQLATFAFMLGLMFFLSYHDIIRFFT